MNNSLSEVLSILSSWQSNSLPVKAALFSSLTGFRVVLPRGTISVEGSIVSVSDASGTVLRLPLAGATMIDLKPSTDFPADLRDEAMSRTVCGLVCRLPDGMMVFLYELWANDAQNITGVS